MGISAIQFRLAPPMKPVIEPRVLSNLPASIRHTADSGAVALACLPLEREPRQPVPCQPLPRAAIVRSHSPIGDRVQNPCRPPWPNSL
ncbi:MAG: hypothetical protein K0S14_1192 [Thermomicrobiales bacterium]|jgi:hypothetical protein|nr:hypothetical protein [Thermomicrobiales bacterium]